MWTRQVSASTHVPDSEVIYRRQGATPVLEVPVAVRFGKPLDVMRLRRFSAYEAAKEAAELSGSIRELYSGGECEPLRVCPACASAWSEADSFAIHGITYGVCRACGHGAVVKRPTKDRLERHFRESAELALTYVESDSAEFRIQEILNPKIDWGLDHFVRVRGREAETIVDVGAGGGHFVEACTRRGLNASGWEISESARTFARQQFGVDLVASDFLSSPNEAVDVLTMWGLLEYVLDPGAFITRAREWLAPDGMLIIEVPRLDSISTAVQRQFPETVVRHLDPGSHINCFSDASLLELLHQSGFTPVAMWFFGMDAYEVLCQLSGLQGHEELVTVAGDLIPTLQLAADHHYFCDDIVVAAVPT